MDFLPRLRQTKPHFSDSISWLLTSDIELDIGIASSRRLLLFAVYHLFARKRNLLFMATNSSSALNQIREQQPTVLIITPDLDNDESGIGLLEQAHEISDNLCSILVVDAIRDDLRLASRSMANCVICEQEIFAPSNPQDQLIIALAKGKDYRSPLIMAAIAAPEAVVLPGADGIDVEIILTRREQEVAAYLMSGDSERLIAKHLAISYATVRSHSQALRRKFGVVNRMQLVLRFKLYGLEEARKPIP